MRVRTSAADARRWMATLVVAGLAGAVFAWLRTPIPWMLGPLVTMAALRMAGAPLAAPPGARQAGQWVIGTALGLYFTPVVVEGVGRLWYLLAAGALFAIAVGYLSGLALARVAGIDRTTSVFASVPGGAAEMSVLGERFGARVDRVAAAQSLRILLVVAIIPPIFQLIGVHGSDRYVVGTSEFDPLGFATLMAATFAGSLVVLRLGVPNSFVLGSLAVAIPLTGAEVHLSSMPTLATNAGQCLLGCALGSRFQPDFLRGAPRFVVGVVLSVLLSIALCSAFAIVLAFASGQSGATLVLGTAPGGIAEMAITAKVLQLGVPIVTAFHVTRVVVLLLVTGPLFSRMRAWKRARTA